MSISTIEWKENKLKIIDQTKLPLKLRYILCKDVDSLWKAIKNMNIRGAPALGVAGAFGVVLAVINSNATEFKGLKRDVKSSIDYFKKARPTAVNLFWALDRMWNKLISLEDETLANIREILIQEALDILQQDRNICRKIGSHGAVLIKNGQNILTHCNTGALATVDFGTALGVFYSAKQMGREFHVYVDETRPRLQGAKLTTWELKQNNIPFTLICDNTAGMLMAKGKIHRVIVGADRIAASGDTANKIGTYALAVLAHYHNIPFHIAAPVSTIDINIQSGDMIPIEERDKKEVSFIENKPVTVKGANIYNPAFDITPYELIDSIITEKGIITPPFKESITKILDEV